MMSFLFKQVNFAVSGLPVASVSLFLKHRYSVPKANYSNLLCYWKILKYTIMAYGQHFRMFWNEHKKSKVGVASKDKAMNEEKHFFAAIHCWLKCVCIYETKSLIWIQSGKTSYCYAFDCNGEFRIRCHLPVPTKAW